MACGAQPPFNVSQTPVPLGHLSGQHRLRLYTPSWPVTCGVRSTGSPAFYHRAPCVMPTGQFPRFAPQLFVYYLLPPVLAYGLCRWKINHLRYAVRYRYIRFSTYSLSGSTSLRYCQAALLARFTAGFQELPIVAILRPASYCHCSCEGKRLIASTLRSDFRAFKELGSFAFAPPCGGKNNKTALNKANKTKKTL